MFSSYSASCNDNGSSNKCSLFALLVARTSALESQLFIMESKLLASIASHSQEISTDQPSLAIPRCPSATLEQPGNQRGRMTDPRRCSSMPKPPVYSQPHQVSKKLSLLCDTAAERPALLIASSILNVKIETALTPDICLDCFSTFNTCII